MGGLRLAALGAAVALWAGPASSDIVRYEATGGFYYVTGPAGWFSAPNCPSVQPVCVNHGFSPGRDQADFTSGAPWTLSFTIDTDLGDLVEGPTEARFDWNTADGQSPLLDGAFDFPIPGLNVDLHNATTIALLSTTSGYRLTLNGSGFDLGIGFLVGPAVVPNLTETAVISFNPVFPNPTSTFSIGDFDGGYSRVGSFSITNLGPSGAVPEPATWALIIGGFGLAGAALRRQRARARAEVSGA